MNISIAGITFDNIEYDSDGDVLYLHVGDPSTAVDFDESPEGHALRYDENGRLVGITLVRPRWLMSLGQPIVVTLPQQVTIQPETLTPALTAA